MRRASDLVAQMSLDLGLLPGHLQDIIRTAPIRYKVFYIPKRSGGLRELAQPAREVKSIQRWLVQLLALFLPLHESATAYRPGASIRENAKKHSASDYLLKLDFRNFFPSILMSDIVRHIEAHCGSELDISAVKLAAYVCTWAPGRQGPLRLCIGAPSSPLLSNSIMYDFDMRLADRAQSDGVNYTRYADDLTLSSNTHDVLKAYPRIVGELLGSLDYPRLSLNEQKTVFASRAGRRVVTGVTLTSDYRISLGRDRKRTIRAMYHRLVLGKLTPEEQDQLGGLIAFAEDIEPGFRAWLAKSARST